MRFVLLTAVVLGSVAGCSDPPRTIRTARQIEASEAADTQVELPPMPAPAASDPAAVAVVSAALGAHTEGKPDLLHKFKSVAVTRQGQMAVGTAPTPVKWQLHAVWPDRLRYRIELPDNQVRFLCAAGDGGWMAAAGQGKQPMPPELVREARADAAAEWLWLLFPLADPAAKLATAPAATVNGKPATGVRVWADGVPNAILHFDAETKLLGQITFEGREGGDRVPKQIQFLTHKAFGGVTLGEKVVVKMVGRTMYDWTTTGVEPDARIDPKLFEDP